MKITFRWEPIRDSEMGWTDRAKVHGGWLVKDHTITESNAVNEFLTVTFVPDPMHEWDVDTVEYLYD